MSKYEEVIMRIIRINDVISTTGLGRSTIYKYIESGEFPKPIPLGERAVGWIEEEVLEWIESKIQLRDVV